MIKFLFFDYRELEIATGFTREPQQPVKDPGNPIFVPDAPWEHHSMQFYGSVIKPPGKPFQMWFSTRGNLCYAESEDGITWTRPKLNLFPLEDAATNNVVFQRPHGAALIYDSEDPREDWQYKMLAGAAPSGCISVFHSPDGIHWQPGVRAPWNPAPYPVIGTNPDCPIGFVRTPDGRYAGYHRWPHYHRRVCRSESWDFTTWTNERRMVFEPDVLDPPQTQFYGMGVTAYGSYELGTLWMYHTDPDDFEWSKMSGLEEAELAYSRSGWAWHRAAQGTPFIPSGGPAEWDRGNLQCASQPVFLNEEIRYYFAASEQRHIRGWERLVRHGGLGIARLKPDRFVALTAGDQPAELLTFMFDLPSTDLFVNADIAQNGSVRVALLDLAANAIDGYELADCEAITGDALNHRVRWRGIGQSAAPVGQRARLRVEARNARVFSIYATEPNERPVYHRFTAARP